MASSFASRAKCVSGCHRQGRNKPRPCNVQVNSSYAVFANNLLRWRYRVLLSPYIPLNPFLQT
jgi:hypothetical protein